MEVVKALYGLPTSENMLNVNSSHNLRVMIFNPTRFDPYVWIRGPEGGHYFIGTHADNDLVVAVKPTSIFNKLKETYTIKAFGPPKVHLGCDYSQVKKGATTR